MTTRAPAVLKNMRGFTRFPECQAHKRVKMKRTNCVWTLTPKPIYWNKWLPTEELELKKKWGKGGNTLWENLYQKYLADRSILEILFDRLKLIKCHIVKLGSAGNKCWRYIFDTPNIFTICNQGVVVMYWKIDVKV